jgi:ribosomal protein L35
MATKLTNRGNKTNKMFAKRLKITSTGKILGRKPGGAHFNARQSRSRQLAGKKMQEFNMSNKDVARFLPTGTQS